MNSTIQKQGMKTTDNSYVYRRLLQYSFHCERCGANRGCNRDGNYSNRSNWKRYRKTQYRA